MTMVASAISRKDLDRIVSSVNDPSMLGSCNVLKKDQLKQLSDTRVAGWTDTLAAKRKAKLDWKAEKARQDEEQRILQDAKDAARRQQVRAETLENADKLVREQTEKVRQFRSQQKLVETIDTRDAQLKDQEEKRKKENAMEELWHMAVMENIQKAEQKTKKEIEQEKQRSSELAEELRRQRDERDERLRAQHRRKREEEVAKLKKLAMDDSAVQKVSMTYYFRLGAIDFANEVRHLLQAKLQQKHELVIKSKESMEKNQLLLEKRQEESRRKELEEARKCEEEVARRRNLSAARAELEIKHFEEKQAMRKLLSDKASVELKQRAMRECEIFERDVRLRQQKEKEKAEAARIKLEQERIAIDESRRQQLQCKVKETEAEKELGELYAKELARITTQQQDLERKKKLSKRKQHIELRDMQQQQIRENEERRAKEKAEALKEEKQVFHKLKKEDDIFKDFVMKEIENFQVQGKRTALLEKTLNS
ncbi:hypothetical protein ACHAXR_008025 [Thalassiosira sp. AJA248-18]